MPNWTENFIKIEHDDPKMIQKFVKSYNENKVCETFIPEPTNYSKHLDPDWYIWRTTNWGIKWDFGRGDNDVIDVDSETTEVTVHFLTPWNEPKTLYEYLTEELGFRIHVEFFEPGMDYLGVITHDHEFTTDFPTDFETLEEYKLALPLSYQVLKEYLEMWYCDDEEEEDVA